MALALIGIDSKSKLWFREGTVDAGRDTETLSKSGFMEELDEKYGAFEWIFQRDSTPCQTCHKGVDWIEDNNDSLSDWLANSPDLISTDCS
jgi:IS1 family transposase